MTMSEWSAPAHPVMHLPADADLLDFSVPAALRAPRCSPYSIGRYNEDRVGLYDAALFDGQRTVHVGIDLGGPVGSAVFAPQDGRVVAVGYKAEPGDYGYVVVIEHPLGGRTVFALYGHLDAGCATRWRAGMVLRAGERIGGLGCAQINGGWPPHVHLQLSLERPSGPDLPGVVAPSERAEALLRYPDPRLLIGPVYA